MVAITHHKKGEGKKVSKLCGSNKNGVKAEFKPKGRVVPSVSIGGVKQYETAIKKLRDS